MYYNQNKTMKPIFQSLKDMHCDHVAEFHSLEDAGSIFTGAMLGLSHTEETKQKISNALKGKTKSNHKNPRSKEHRQKLSDVLKGRKLTEEHKQKLSEAQQKRESPSEETRKLMSLASKNRSAESRKKAADLLRGKPRSEETKQKLREAAKKQWERIRAAQHDLKSLQE